MLLAMAGAMSTAELGISLAEMIRQEKIHAVSCTAATEFLILENLARLCRTQLDASSADVRVRMLSVNGVH